jgi:hypothetical protein
MSVKILFDPVEDQAALYCNTDGRAFGPLFEGDAEAKAEAFCEWFTSGEVLEAAAHLNISPYHGFDGTDPRSYTAADLDRLYQAWWAAAIDSDGNLKTQAWA